MNLENNQKFQKIRKIAPKRPISEISTHYEQIETDGVQSYGTMYQDISSHSDVGNLMPVTSVYSVSDGIQTNEPYQESFTFEQFCQKLAKFITNFWSKLSFIHLGKMSLTHFWPI